MTEVENLDAFCWSGCRRPLELRNGKEASAHEKLQWLYCTLGIPGVSSTIIALTSRRRDWEVVVFFFLLKLRLLTSCISKGQLPQTHCENEWHLKHLETLKKSDFLPRLWLDSKCLKITKKVSFYNYNIARAKRDMFMIRFENNIWIFTPKIKRAKSS